MSIPEFISSQPEERQELLSKLHEIIIQKDKTVTAEVATMMRTEMIVYNAPGSFKYGLASLKKYMSLHLLPMYVSPAIYEKYKRLLKNASFQKGCINFTNKDEMPLKIIKDLIGECAKIDLKAIREEQLKWKLKKK